MGTSPLILTVLTLSACDLPSIPSWDVENRLSAKTLPLGVESLIPGDLEDQKDRWAIRAITKRETYQAQDIDSKEAEASPQTTWQESISVPIGNGVEAAEGLTGTVQVALQPEDGGRLPSDSDTIAVELRNDHGRRLAHQERVGPGVVQLGIDGEDLGELTVAWTMEVEGEAEDGSGTIQMSLDAEDLEAQRVQLTSFSDEVGPYITEVRLEGGQGSVAKMESLLLRARNEASLALEGTIAFVAVNDKREMPLEEESQVEFVLTDTDLDQVIESGGMTVKVQGSVTLPRDTWIAPNISGAIKMETYAKHKLTP